METYMLLLDVFCLNTCSASSLEPSKCLFNLHSLWLWATVLCLTVNLNPLPHPHQLTPLQQQSVRLHHDSLGCFHSNTTLQVKQRKNELVSWIGRWYINLCWSSLRLLAMLSGSINQDVICIYDFLKSCVRMSDDSWKLN